MSGRGRGAGARRRGALTSITHDIIVIKSVAPLTPQCTPRTQKQPAL